MATITLDTGAASITIQAPKYPDEPGESYPMIVGRTWGGGFKIADFGDGTEWDNPILQFQNMSAADYTALRTFIHTTIEWHKTAFTYTDPYSANHTNMHYLAGFDEFRRVKGRWNGTLEFSKDMSA